MRDVWHLPAIAKWEKSCGKHPTQKPLSVLSRIILASTPNGAWVLDPFTGSSTTGIAANLFNRRFLGIDIESEYLNIGKARKEEIIDPVKRLEYIDKLHKQSKIISSTNSSTNIVTDVMSEYFCDLPF